MKPLAMLGFLLLVLLDLALALGVVALALHFGRSRSALWLGAATCMVVLLAGWPKGSGR
ncbi:MAG TPA: hypothetical protein VNK82_03605 [Terriglobales bacterium]|nr:hypothetical protein [Terriglobales bacterium]